MGLIPLRRKLGSARIFESQLCDSRWQPEGHGPGYCARTDDLAGEGRRFVVGPIAHAVTISFTTRVTSGICRLAEAVQQTH